MVSFIFYFKDSKHTNQSILDLLDNTAKEFIDEIIVCLDSNDCQKEDINIPFDDITIRIMTSDVVGRSLAWDNAATEATGEYLVFIGGPTKFTQNWIDKLIDSLGTTDICSPIVHSLDEDLWSLTDIKSEKYGWRWDLQLYSKEILDDVSTISVSSQCFIIKKQRYMEIGGLDKGMIMGCGEDIELSYRNIALGGDCIICKECVIGSAAVRESILESTHNLNRIINIWFPEYIRYFTVSDNSDCGKLTDILKYANKRKRVNEDILYQLQPELFGVNLLKNLITDKSLAIVAPGASLDYIDKAVICRHDVIIGVDYIGMIYDCDFVITDSTEIISELSAKYSIDQMILPTIISNISTGRYDSSQKLYPKAKIFELGKPGALSAINANPPFINANNLAVTSLHMALHFKPKMITLYGYDYSLVNDRSHIMTSRYYADGKILPDSQMTADKYKFEEYLLHLLKDFAISNAIPIIRVNHL